MTVIAETVPELTAGPGPDPVAAELLAPIAPAPGDRLEPVGLAAACAPGGVLHAAGVTLAAARQARQRDAVFPAEAELVGAEKRYAPAELERWARNRVRGVAR